VTDPPGDIQRPLDEGRPADAPADRPVPADRLAAPPADESALPPTAASAAQPAAQPPAESTLPPAGESAAAGDQVTGPTVPLRPAAPGADTEAEDAATIEVTAEPAADSPPLALVYRRRLGRTLRRTRAGVSRAGQAVAAWARRPAGRLVLPGLLVSALLTAAVSTGALVVPTAWGTDPSDPAPATPGVPGGSAAPTVAPGQVPPVVNPGTGLPQRPGNPAAPLAGWAEQMSGRTAIPVVAIQAYAYAELVVAASEPQCNLRWTTLAGIGRVESGHGTGAGATLLEDGRALPPIIGDPLDGQDDRMLIPDSDAGQLDGDRTYDRAVGPMQFIPTTWRVEAIDATGDGIADVNNIYDAALAAANYLCRNGRDLSDVTEWWAAILSYNNLTAYANAVFAAANQYGQRSHGG
jgi:hypothetical protein